MDPTAGRAGTAAPRRARAGGARVAAVSLAAVALAAVVLAGSAGTGASAAAPVPPIDVTGTVHGALAGTPQVFTGATLTDLAFTTPRDGMAVGVRNCPVDGVLTPCGSVTFTTGDGGRTWSRRYGGPGRLTAVVGLPGGVAWAWGGCAPSSSPDYAVGSGPCHETLLRTTDAGASWTAADPPAQAADFAFVSALDGFATAQPCSERRWGSAPQVPSTPACRGLVWSTGDGGATWTPVATFPGPALAVASTGGVVDVAWYRAEAGVAVGSVITVSASDDGGTAWSTRGAVTVPGDTPQATLGFTGAADGWLSVFDPDSCAMHGCGVADAYRTLDGGATWDRVGVPPGGGAPGCGPAGPVGLWASGDTVALASGVNLAACAPPGGRVDVSQDGGATWPVASAWPTGQPAAVTFVSPATGFLLFAAQGVPATEEVVMATADGGRTWQQRSPALQPLDGIDFVSARRGFGAGSGTDPGAVLATADGGRRWAEVAHLAGQVLSLAFADPRHGWALLEPQTPGALTAVPGEILTTADGGRRWRVAARLRGDYQSDSVSPAGARRATLVTPEGLATTTDGGATWTPALRALQVGPTRIPCLFGLPVCRGVGVMTGVGTVAGRLWLVTGGLGQPFLLQQATGNHLTRWRTLPFPASHASGDSGIGAGVSPAGTVWVDWQPTAYVRSVVVSDDRGGTWRRIDLPRALGVADAEATPGAVSFATAQDGWVLTHQGLWRTTDGGARWALVSGSGRARAAPR